MYSQAALEVVITTTSSAASDYKVVKVTTSLFRRFNAAKSSLSDGDSAPGLVRLLYQQTPTSEHTYFF